MTDAPNDTLTGPEPGRSANELIRRLNDGALTGDGLSVAERLLVVERMMEERVSVNSIASVLRMSARNVRRDQQKIREANALKPGPGFAAEVAGNLMREAQINIELAHKALKDGKDGDKKVSAADRIACARVCWSISRELVASLQDLGYLPKAPLEIHGEMHHHVQDETPAVTALAQELERLAIIAQGVPAADEHIARIEILRQDVRKIEVSEKLKALSSTLEERKEGNDEVEDS